MPRRSRLAVTAVALTTLAAASLAPRPAAADGGLEGVVAIHLEGDFADGYTRPRLANAACLVERLEEQPAAAGFDGKVAFTVQRDGSLTDLTFSPPPPPRMELAVRTAFTACPWSQGLDPAGKPLVVRVTQPVKVKGRGAGLAARPSAGPVGPGLAPPPVPFGGASLDLRSERAAAYRRPTLADPACLQVALRRHTEVAGLDNKVKFAVMRDGSVRQFSFLAPVAPEVERAVVAAFEACRWDPGLDPEGTPLAVWVIQPLKVAGLPAAPEQALR
ncbi:MAG: hypothetical protein IPO09_21855 [Anaeromyxobacter sp.]|nr:hypothetical protein [Anaeromyxobacter sp.]MBL0274593.1 hypothetical protein [Anaeromyxobacter sp.]